MTTLFENGEKVSEVPYLSGLKDGVEKKYRNGEIVVEEISWAADLQHGPTTKKIGTYSTTDYFFRGKPVSQGAFERMTYGGTQR